MNARKQRWPSASPLWGGRTTEVNHTFSEVAAGTANIPAAQYGLVTGHQYQVVCPKLSAEARPSATKALWNGRVSMVQQAGAANVCEIKRSVCLRRHSSS